MSSDPHVESSFASTSKDGVSDTGSPGSNRTADSAANSQRFDSGLLEEMLRKKTASAMTQRNNSDSWETRATKGIHQKKLSLTLTWSEKTWVNKSNCIERLKLLKDDGVDISSLQGQDGKQLDSAAITRAVLAQVNVKRQNNGARDTAQSALDARAPNPRQDSDHKEAPAAVSDLAECHAGTQLSRKRSREESPGPGFPSSPLHSTDNDSAHKRLCLNDIRNKQGILMAEQPEEIYPVWAHLKKKVLTEIFTAFPDGSQDTCHISIAFPSQTAQVDVPGDLELTSSGYDNIMLELKTLADSNGDDDDNDGALNIRDTDSSIRVITNVPLRTIIEGQHRHVRGLLTRLATPGKGLTHMAVRNYDDNGSRRVEGDVYELSNKTQEQINGILGVLETAQETGGLDVQVRWVNVGKVGKWPAKMYY